MTFRVSPINCAQILSFMILLRFKTLLFCLVLVFFLLGSTLDSFAESAIQCHCFKNRSYNPADKFASDDYILATSFNSLLAKVFSIPKKQIIMIKMDEGVGQDDLLIGFKISKTTGIDIRNYLRLRNENKSWTEIVSDLPQQEKSNNDPLLEAIRSGMPVEEAGDRIADEMISQFYQVSPEEIEQLKMSGLNEKEMALLFVLVHYGGQKPEVLVKQYKKQGRSWSEIAYNLGLEPDAAGKLILAYPAMKIAE